MKLLALVGATVGGAVGWWLGSLLGLMAAFFFSVIGAAAQGLPGGGSSHAIAADAAGLALRTSTVVRSSIAKSLGGARVMDGGSGW